MEMLRTTDMVFINYVHMYICCLSTMHHWHKNTCLSNTHTTRFRVQISGVHALRLISRAGKEVSTVSSIICDRWLILS